MTMNYKNKIKTKEEIVAALGDRKGKTVVMCHGCFDIVHPGHIRHLTFAKSKGDILIVSITSDDKVRKGHDRPYIPQELRAENLAAFEFVDYVTIDDNLTPIECINTIKPDIFVKGAEYDGGRPADAEKTAEERRAVEAYGGRMIFSPGDIVYSSTAILEEKKPYIDIDVEKVRALLEAYEISRDSIVRTVEAFNSTRVLLIGDTILDRYTYCTTLGKTAKTPTLSVRKNASEDFAGGAALVAAHIRSLGAQVKFITVLGDDEPAQWIRGQLEKAGVDFVAFTDKSRPTTLKERFWADGYKLLQVDVLDNAPIAPHIEEQVIGALEKEIKRCDVVVFSDFSHGLLTKGVIDWTISAARERGCPYVADAQVSNRWGNILQYQGADLICPNELEARFALRDQDSGVVPLGRKLREATRAKYLILKLGDKGIIAFQEHILNPYEGGFPRSRAREFYPLPPFERRVVDTLGAGDALLGAATLAYCHASHLLTIAFIANCAAAVRVRKPGNVTINRDELLEFAVKQYDYIMGHAVPEFSR
jgi:rfaE bifunctional protein kinase chain/domain/rfaE bifunctional protein nucleotidyltransferase chain/domain